MYQVKTVNVNDVAKLLNEGKIVDSFNGLSEKDSPLYHNQNLYLI